jgi:hypothetical protein
LSEEDITLTFQYIQSQVWWHLSLTNRSDSHVEMKKGEHWEHLQIQQGKVEIDCQELEGPRGKTTRII